jgi:hypothetical protein
MIDSSVSPREVPQRNGPGPGSIARECFTPAGQRLVVEHNREGWVAICGHHEPVRHRDLHVALIEAIRADQQAHWGGIEPDRWAWAIADVVMSNWREPD